MARSLPENRPHLHRFCVFLDETQGLCPGQYALRLFLNVAFLVLFPVAGFADEPLSGGRFSELEETAPLPDPESSFQSATEKSGDTGFRRQHLYASPEPAVWNLPDRWYPGRQRLDGTRLAPVWRKVRARSSLDPGGVRLTRSL